MRFIDSIIDSIRNNWELYLIGFVLILILISAFAFLGVGRAYDSYFKQQIANKSNSVRVFSIDCAMEIVTYFNITRLRDIRKMKLNDFYDQFAEQDRGRLAQWIADLMNPDVFAPGYLEINVRVDRDGKDYFSMLQLDWVNYADGIIHLQSFLYKYVPTDTSRLLKKTTTKAELVEQISRSSTSRGVSVCVRFTYKYADDEEKPLNPIVYASLKNQMYKLLDSPKIFLLEPSGNEIIISDLKVNSPKQIRLLVHQMTVFSERFLALNALTSSVDFRIGGVEHRFFPNDGEAIIAEARNCARLAGEIEQKEKWYNPARVDTPHVDAEEEEVSYRTEVERVIREKRLEYFFRPMYSVIEKRAIGTLAKVTPRDSFFSTIEELKKYADKANDGQSLFSTVSRETLQRFSAQRPNEDFILFYPIMVSELQYLLSTFIRLSPAKGSRVCFVISEDDLTGHLDRLGLEALRKAVTSVRGKGYEFAVLIGEKLSLPDELYPLFDNYIVSFAFAGAATGIDTRIRADLHASVEKLIKYKKPIMASDLDGWNAVELMVRSGLDYISADALAPYLGSIAEIPPKNLRKINDMRK